MLIKIIDDGETYWRIDLIWLFGNSNLKNVFNTLTRINGRGERIIVKYEDLTTICVNSKVYWKKNNQNDIENREKEVYRGLLLVKLSKNKYLKPW